MLEKDITSLCLYIMKYTCTCIELSLLYTKHSTELTFFIIYASIGIHLFPRGIAIKGGEKPFWNHKLFTLTLHYSLSHFTLLRCHWSWIMLRMNLPHNLLQCETKILFRLVILLLWLSTHCFNSFRVHGCHLFWWLLSYNYSYIY